METFYGSKWLLVRRSVSNIIHILECRNQIGLRRGLNIDRNVTERSRLHLIPSFRPTLMWDPLVYRIHERYRYTVVVVLIPLRLSWSQALLFLPLPLSLTPSHFWWRTLLFTRYGFREALFFAIWDSLGFYTQAFMIFKKQMRFLNSIFNPIYIRTRSAMCSVPWIVQCHFQNAKIYFKVEV